jgi:hypothetical protein
MRRVLNIVTVASCLSLLTIALLWISSYTWAVGFGVSDQIDGDAPAHRSYKISSLRGSLMYEYNVRDGMPAGPSRWSFDWIKRSEINVFIREYYENHPPFVASKTSDGTGDFAVYISLPHWLFVVFSAILPAAWLIRMRRQRRRLRDGLCERCGYDLRGTPGQCPECGDVNTRT